MIKAIIFDFDGVLVESTHIKTEAFRKLFTRWPDKVDEIVSFHLINMGISRYVKFEHFYNNILNEPYSQEIGVNLGRQFSEIVIDEIKKAPLVRGAKEFLMENFQKYLLFIASGTPQDELVEIVNFKGLSGFFKSIFGTPSTKISIVNNILNDHLLRKDQVLFVGDAESDKIAAEGAGVNFIARLNDENTFFSDQEWKINDITELDNIIKELENLKAG